MLTYAITYILPSISWKFVFLHDCTHIYIYPVHGFVKLPCVCSNQDRCKMGKVTTWSSRTENKVAVGLYGTLTNIKV